MATSRGHKLTERPNGKYVKQTSSQEPMDGLETYLAEMFLARSLSSVVTFCSDRPPFKMATKVKMSSNFNCNYMARSSLTGPKSNNTWLAACNDHS
jgi:hypothetical protein